MRAHKGGDTSSTKACMYGTRHAGHEAREAREAREHVGHEVSEARAHKESTRPVGH